MAGIKQKLLKKETESAYGKRRKSRIFGRECSIGRKEVSRMGLGTIIILIFSALLALIIYLYQEHVDYLNKKIRDLQFEVDFTKECLDAHKEMVEDLEGYYEKWRETVDELNKAEQTIWEYKANLAEAVKRIGEYEKELDMR